MTFNPTAKILTMATDDSPIRDMPYEMSPVTDLAMNLSELSTASSMNGTPCRRISWSNPFPGGSKKDRICEETSPYADSPTFQDMKINNLQRKVKKKTKLFKEVHNICFQNKNDENKENCMPIPVNVPKFMQGLSPKLLTDTVFDSDSQDSGYSGGLSQNSNFGDPLPRQYSRTNVRSSLFSSDDGEDGFENILEIDNFDDEDFSKMPNTMSNLLTKPIASPHGSHHSLYALNQIESTAKKKSKLPTRRCLSMEMDCDVDSLNFAVSPTICSPKLKANSLNLSSSMCEHNNNVDEEISYSSNFVDYPTTSPSLFDGDEFVITDGRDQNNTDEIRFPKKCAFKRPEPPNNYLIHSKRRKSSPCVDSLIDSAHIKSFVFQRSYSETSATIMCAVQKSDLQPELIGDCSKSYALPLVKGKHQDLKSISSETLVNLIQGKYREEVRNFTLVDCRYPYEYEAGHIQSAKNIFTREDVLERFLSGCPSTSSERNIIIFHCEFSSERAPSLCRFLRNKDREKNESKYPQLHQPEIYLLDGGYKAFFQDYKQYCEPQDYKPMIHKDHGSELRQFRAKSKSWGGDSRGRTKLRTASRC